MAHLPSMPRADAILVVDDDADSRAMLVEYLRCKGFAVHAAPTDETALALADTLRPRVILMDFSMSNLDGLETMRRLRANQSTGEATFVMVTARALIGERKAVHHAGSDFFIQKTIRSTHGRHVSHRPDGGAAPDCGASPAELRPGWPDSGPRLGR